MNKYQIYLKRQVDGEHVFVESGNMSQDQNITSRLYICLMEEKFKVTPVGRRNLLVPGITISELQAVVDKYFNSQLFTILID